MSDHTNPLPHASAVTLPRVEVTNPMCGLCHMQVCAIADATDEEILMVCNRKCPSGTTGGWTKVIRQPSSEGFLQVGGPVECHEHKGRFHLLVEC